MHLFQVVILFLLVALPFAVAMADDETVSPPRSAAVGTN
jgi:hypothetical protein